MSDSNEKLHEKTSSNSNGKDSKVSPKTPDKIRKSDESKHETRTDKNSKLNTHRRTIDFQKKLSIDGLHQPLIDQLDAINLDKPRRFERFESTRDVNSMQLVPYRKAEPIKSIEQQPSTSTASRVSTSSERKRSPPKERVPYFADAIREKERIQRKYQRSSSPRTRYSSKRSLSPRRYRSRSRERYRCRSRSRDRSRDRYYEKYRRSRSYERDRSDRRSRDRSRDRRSRDRRSLDRNSERSRDRYRYEVRERRRSRDRRSRDRSNDRLRHRDERRRSRSMDRSGMDYIHGVGGSFHPPGQRMIRPGSMLPFGGYPVPVFVPSFSWMPGMRPPPFPPMGSFPLRPRCWRPPMPRMNKSMRPMRPKENNDQNTSQSDKNTKKDDEQSKDDDESGEK